LKYIALLKSFSLFLPSIANAACGTTPTPYSLLFSSILILLLVMLIRFFYSCYKNSKEALAVKEILFLFLWVAAMLALNFAELSVSC
jgi:hypothetical protein